MSSIGMWLDVPGAAHGRLEYCHKSASSCSSAFDLNEKVKIKLFISRSAGASSASVSILSEDLISNIRSYQGEWEGIVLGCDEYVFSFSASDIPVNLYFLQFKIKCGTRELIAFGTWNSLCFSESKASGVLPQISITSFDSPEPSHIYGGIIYHVFVDRFNRGGVSVISNGARLIGGEWDEMPEYPEYPGAPLKNNTFYGGTLHGVTDKLDYIASLGVNTIYLSPIFSSPSNHKYDTSNYKEVDEMFGGVIALKRLIKEAEKRGIKIILDGVFNHTGADSIYFNKYSKYNSIGAFQSKQSPYYSWFDFKEYPNRYTCWWDIEILPRINPDIPECREYFVGKGGVISQYSKLGIYGWRLDVADELSDDFISEIKSRISSFGENVLYGEVWEDASNKIAYEKRKKYYLGKELDGVMNYPLRTGIIRYLSEGDTSALEYAISQVFTNAPDRILHAQMNLLGTHDTERIITVLSGDEFKEASLLKNHELAARRLSPAAKSMAKKKLMSAYTILATLPGVPAIFYGDEAGLEGYHDPFNRMPYPWGREDPEILSHYKMIGKIRRSASVYKRGSMKVLSLENDRFAFSRTENGNSYITICNNSADNLMVNFEKKADPLIISSKHTSFIIPPHSSEIFKTQSGQTLVLQKEQL